MSVSPSANPQHSRGPFSGLSHAREQRLDRINNLQQNPSAQLPYSFLRCMCSVETSFIAYSPFTAESSGSRSTRDSPLIPPLVHEETTLSSESSGFTSIPYQGTQPLQIEAPKPHPHRLLPAPVPTPGVMSSPLDTTRPPLPAPFGTVPQDLRQTTPMASLLRAGELARESEMRSEETNLRKDPPDRPP